MADRADITPELCRQLLNYDPETGRLFWQRRPREIFTTQRAWASWNTKHGGKEALCQINEEGYLRGVLMRQTFRASRIAWAVHYGRWPEGEIDHIDGDKGNNRIGNLRDVLRAENSKNRRLRRDNSSGATGVRLDLNTMRWRASIKALGRNLHLGVFATREEAITARETAKAKYGYHPNHGES